MTTNKPKYEIPFIPDWAKASCEHCGFSNTWKQKRNPAQMFFLDPSSGRDPIFGYPLLLRTPCKGHTLFALNEDHLSDIREYIEMKIRPRPANKKWAMVNNLPEWMKLAKNRVAVLKGLEKLEAQLQHP